MTFSEGWDRVVAYLTAHVRCGICGNHPKFNWSGNAYEMNLWAKCHGVIEHRRLNHYDMSNKALGAAKLTEPWFASAVDYDPAWKGWQP